jgi:hypothetical protein
MAARGLPAAARPCCCGTSPICQPNRARIPQAAQRKPQGCPGDLRRTSPVRPVGAHGRKCPSPCASSRHGSIDVRGHSSRSVRMSSACQEAHPVDPLFPRPSGPQQSPIESPSNRAATDFGRVLGADERQPKRSRIGSSKVPLCNSRRMALFLLGVIVLPCLPIWGPPNDATPAKRVPGFGDVPILGFAFAPRWRDGRDHPGRWARRPEGHGRRSERPLLPGLPRSGPGPGVLARRPIAGRGRR